MVSAETIVSDFEKKSGEKQSADAAREVLQDTQERLRRIEGEAEDILENGYMDGFNPEELQEAVDQVKRKVEKETKLVSLVLALAWRR